MTRRLAVLAVVSLILVACVPGRAAAPSVTPTKPAELAILSPADGATVIGREIAVRGTGPAGAIVTRDIAFAPDDHVSVAADGTWTLTIRLEAGSHTLVFRLDADRSTERRLTLFVSEVGPSANEVPATPDATVADPVTPTAGSSPSTTVAPIRLAVLWPADGSTVGADSWTLLGRAPAGATITLECDTFCTSETRADAFGRWSIVVQGLGYGETTAVTLHAGSETIRHGLRYDTVERGQQLTVPEIQLADGTSVPELEIVSTRVSPYSLSGGLEYGAQLIVTVRNRSPGPIALEALGTGVESTYQLFDTAGNPTSGALSTVTGILNPFPQLLGPGQVGYLLAEEDSSGYYDATSFGSAKVAIAYDYVAFIPASSLATVTTTVPQPFDYGFRVTGAFTALQPDLGYAVAVLALDGQGKPVGFAVDPRTSGGTRWASWQMPPNYEVCCFRGFATKPATLLGLAFQHVDVETPGWSY